MQARPCSILTGARVVVPDDYSRVNASRYGEANPKRHEERRGRSRSLRLGGRCAVAPAFRHDRDLRDARRRLHAASELRGLRGAARDLCGHDREDPVSAGSRDHRRRAAARIPVRPRRTARRAWSITGAIPRSRFSLRMPATVRGRIRSARSTSSATSSRRLHRAGIEVILDVVYNHTAEGNAKGPRSASAVSRTKSITFSIMTAPNTQITAAPEIR